LSKEIVGNRGLFFTNETEQKVNDFFRTYKEQDFARAGLVSSETITLPVGPCEMFPHSIEPYLRTELMVPTSLQKGVVHVEKEFVVCKSGEALTPEQARLLKLMNIKMSEFTFELSCMWSGGKFNKYDTDKME